jgi:hypothetical protein
VGLLDSISALSFRASDLSMIVTLRVCPDPMVCVPGVCHTGRSTSESIRAERAHPLDRADRKSGNTSSTHVLKLTFSLHQNLLDRNISK